MNWKQPVDPFAHIALSALVAALPILFVFWALLIKKMKGYRASLWATALAIPIAVFIYRMPVQLAMLSTLHGMMYGIFPICWIMITAVFLFNLTVKSGRFEIIKQFMATITPDRRLQALLIAFSFGSFLEGTAGFGSPVAITAAMLVGLGFDPLYAAGICLISNTAPVAFGSIGIPVTVASQVTGIPEMTISQMVGRTLPFLSMLLPFYLVVLMAGFRKALEVLPAILVSGLSFAFFQWFMSNFSGPALPDIIAGVASIISLLILLKYWKPGNAWRFPNEPPVVITNTASYSTRTLARAWAPFMVLTVFVIIWGLKPVKVFLDGIGLFSFPIPGLHDTIVLSEANKLLPQVFKFNFLSASGTAILLAAVASLPLLGLGFKDGLKTFLHTLVQLKIPIVTIAAVLGFAYILNNSGMTLTLSKVLSNTGILFPFFAPVLGWLGVFVTGSDTSSNALFCNTQKATAVSIGVDPVITVAANISGGVVGKMISPSSIAVAAAAGSMIGKESDLLRFTVKHSFIMLLFISILTLAQAYWLKWMIP
jgi:lactate permease